MISAVGVTGNIENLGLEKLGVKIDRGTIVIDGACRTNVPGIYAIGDVAGPPMLAHKAEHEGVICVEAIKGLNPHPMDKLKIPGCTYCYPQIASVGLTEAAAKDKKLDIRVGRFPFVGNGKAIALGEDQGLVKVIFDKATGALLGAHMVGAEVTELIQGFVIAMNLETTEEELMHTDLPASDPIGNDEGGGARRLWPGAEHVRRAAEVASRWPWSGLAQRERARLFTCYCVRVSGRNNPHGRGSRHGKRPGGAAAASREGPSARCAGAAQTGLDQGQGAGLARLCRRLARSCGVMACTRSARRRVAQISASAGRKSTRPS